MTSIKFAKSISQWRWSV